MKLSDKNRTNDRVQLLSPYQRHWVSVSSRLLPRWTAGRAERLLVRPPRKRGRAAEVLDVWGRRADIDVGGRALAAWHFGEQDVPRVLMVHGWGGYGAQFAPWVPALLAQGRSVTLFDLPGHGESAGRAGRVDEFMAAIRVMLESLPRVTALVAHSMGGAASVQILREWQGLARAVVLAAPASLAQHMHDLSGRVGLGRAAHASLVDRLGARYRPVAELDDLSDLPRAATKALFIHDRADAEVDFAHLARFEALWPGCESMATDGLGHYRVLKDAAVIARAVGFIAAG